MVSAGIFRSTWQRLSSRLRIRILLPTGILFSLTLGAMAVGALQLHGTDVARHQAEHAELFAEIVANGLVTLMRDHGPTAPEVNAFLGVVASHRSDLRSISLVRPDGTVTHSSQLDLVGQRPAPVPEGTSALGGVPLIGRPRAVAIRRSLAGQESSCGGCHQAGPRVGNQLELRFSTAAVGVAESHLASVLLATALPALFVPDPGHRLASAPRGDRPAARAGEHHAEGRGRRPVGPRRRGPPRRAGHGGARLRRHPGGAAPEPGGAGGLLRERMVRADRFATVGEMATGLAHEIKNPLAGLSGALELLAEDLAGNPRRRRWSARCATRCSALYRHHGEPALASRARPRPACAHRRERGPGEGALPGPPAAPPAPVHVEPTWPRAAARAGGPRPARAGLPQLCLNACQAMGPAADGSRVPQPGHRDGRVAVDVEDTGPGIPPENARPPLQAVLHHQARGQRAGARHLRAHRGRARRPHRLPLPPGGGTVFTVSLPPHRPQRTPTPEQAA